VGVDDAKPRAANASGRGDGGAGETAEDVEVEVVGEEDSIVGVHCAGSHAETCNLVGDLGYKKNSTRMWRS
jgi:hypothetical protein